MSFQNTKLVARDVNSDEYHTQTVERGSPSFVMSPTSIRNFGFCPSRWKAGYEPKDSESKKIGSLFDVRLLTPGQFNRRYAVRPETYPESGMQCPACKSITDSKSCRACKTERKEITIQKPWARAADFCADWEGQCESKGVTVIWADELAECDAAIARFKSDEIVGAFLECSDTQVWIKAEWHDDATGIAVPVQCLIDCVPRNDSIFRKTIGDIKRTFCAKPFVWQRFAERVGYDLQGAWNFDLYRAAFQDEDRTTFVWYLSEMDFPYEPGHQMAGEDTDRSEGLLTSGRRKYEKLMAEYCKAIKLGVFPGYDNTDEGVQGHSVWRPDPYMAQRDAFAPKYEFGPDEEAAEPLNLN